ncbi:MAG: SCO family protein [Sphingomicrobium sp.]
MTSEPRPPSSPLRQLRLLLWAAVAITVALYAFMLLRPATSSRGEAAKAPVSAPFTLLDAKGRPFSSSQLAGKPYALYFGFTRCGDVCPTTLGRMARLREQAGGPDTFNLLFITIDPENDGPAEVGQYATLFNTPIIGLTGSKDAIGRVKRSYGIHAERTPHAGAGMEMEHTTTVLLFDREGRRAGSISPNDSDAAALAALKRLIF